MVTGSPAVVLVRVCVGVPAFGVVVRGVDVRAGRGRGVEARDPSSPAVAEGSLPEAAEAAVFPVAPAPSRGAEPEPPDPPLAELPPLPEPLRLRPLPPRRRRLGAPVPVGRLHPQTGLPNRRALGGGRAGSGTVVRVLPLGVGGRGVIRRDRVVLVHTGAPFARCEGTRRLTTWGPDGGCGSDVRNHHGFG